MRAQLGSIILVVAVSCTTPTDDNGESSTSSTSVTTTASTTTSTTTQQSTVVTVDEYGIDLESLVDQLAAAGATIGAEESTTDRFFASASTSRLCLDGRLIQVFSFDSLADQRQASATIDKDDPSRVGNSIIEWVAPPTFWGAGRIIVQYIGNDTGVRDLVSDILGRPVAAGVTSRAGAEPSCRAGA